MLHVMNFTFNVTINLMFNVSNLTLLVFQTTEFSMVRNLNLFRLINYGFNIFGLLLLKWFESI